KAATEVSCLLGAARVSGNVLRGDCRRPGHHPLGGEVVAVPRSGGVSGRPRTAGAYRHGMSCDRERLSYYLDGELSDEEISQLREHLAVCQRCAADLVALRKAQDSLKRLDRQK